jgi:hypothetical protein
MDDGEDLNPLFREAVAQIDAGNVSALERLLSRHPRLASERLRSPGAWLRETVGRALDGFFRDPYLLWFVAEDPSRNGTLPANIAQVTRTIIEAARQQPGATLQEQVDYALLLVAWSDVAHQAGVQIELIDVLLDAGARPEAVPDNALVNGHVAAAEHLVRRGAPVTLATALCLEKWEDAKRLAQTATDRQKQFALVLAALNGKANALATLIALGLDVNAPSPDLYAHATPLHHAVCSGSLEAVKVLVEAGASLDAQDHAFHATPLEWAEHYQRERAGNGRGERYAAIAEYLRGRASATCRSE